MAHVGGEGNIPHLVKNIELYVSNGESKEGPISDRNAIEIIANYLRQHAEMGREVITPITNAMRKAREEGKTNLADVYNLVLGMLPKKSFPLRPAVEHQPRSAAGQKAKSTR